MRIGAVIGVTVFTRLEPWLLLDEARLVQRRFYRLLLRLLQGGVEILEYPWRVRALDRVEAVSDEALQMRGEVALDEVNLASQLHVLLVQVVTVKSFQPVNVRLRANRQRIAARLVVTIGSFFGHTGEQALLLVNLLNYVAQQGRLATFVCAGVSHFLSSFRAALALVTLLAHVQPVVRLVADRVALVATKQSASDMLFLLEIYLRQSARKLQILVGRDPRRQIQPVLQVGTLVAKFCKVFGAPLAIFATAHHTVLGLENRCDVVLPRVISILAVAGSLL